MTNLQAIEQLAVNSWKSAGVAGAWRNVGMQFFGIYRLMSWQSDEEAADLADFLSSLATYRAEGLA